MTILSFLLIYQQEIQHSTRYFILVKTCHTPNIGTMHHNETILKSASSLCQISEHKLSIAFVVKTTSTSFAAQDFSWQQKYNLQMMLVKYLQDLLQSVSYSEASVWSPWFQLHCESEMWTRLSIRLTKELRPRVWDPADVSKAPFSF